MNKELRHGKYTDEAYADKVMSRLRLFEQEKIIKGLNFLELKLQDFLFHVQESINANVITKNYILNLMDEKAAQISSKEQAIVFCDFTDTLPNLLAVCEELSLEEDDAKGVISGYEEIIKHVPAIRRRYGKAINTDTEAIIKNISDELVELKNKNFKLKWNKSEDILTKLTNELFENETTNGKNDFANAINKGEMCTINSRRKDFFVMLFYELTKGQEPFIITDRKKGKGAISAAQRFFCHKLKTGYRKISMPDKMKRINQKLLENDENLRKTMEDVNTFLKKF